MGLGFLSNLANSENFTRDSLLFPKTLNCRNHSQNQVWETNLQLLRVAQYLGYWVTTMTTERMDYMILIGQTPLFFPLQSHILKQLKSSWEKSDTCAHTLYFEKSSPLLQMNAVIFAPDLMLLLFSQGQGLTHIGKEHARIRDLFL